MAYSFVVVILLNLIGARKLYISLRELDNLWKTKAATLLLTLHTHMPENDEFAFVFGAD